MLNHRFLNLSVPTASVAFMNTSWQRISGIFKNTHTSPSNTVLLKI